MDFQSKEQESESNKLKERIEKLGKTVTDLETAMMLLVMGYIFFQGAIFASVFHNPSNMSCEYWWIPFTLSCLICVIFAIPFQSYVTNWERTKHHHSSAFLKQDLLNHKMVTSSSVETRMYDQPQSQPPPQPQGILKSDRAQVYQRNAFIYLVSLALLAYTILILKACGSIPCHGDATP
ncbi:PREDICTED: conserved [Prunus dulcis]|uniref:PREDICTED: conserved n=1 Tax=Prunus dulcis TaxID=3755 RepID=A0A5E4EGS9_PRUDU|nr:hypothetical protein L3X38_007692 [Prunus dulcis]VVA14995.1 PREDICTED: conserved [Prunus dulcis]